MICRLKTCNYLKKLPHIFSHIFIFLLVKILEENIWGELRCCKEGFEKQWKAVVLLDSFRPSANVMRLLLLQNLFMQICIAEKLFVPVAGHNIFEGPWWVVKNLSKIFLYPKNFWDKVRRNELIVASIQFNTMFHSYRNRLVICTTEKLPSQAFTSKSKIETLEKGVKYFQSYQDKYQNDVIDVILMFPLITLNIFHTFL